MKVRCPACGADVGVKCIGSSGQQREGCHRERHQLLRIGSPALTRPRRRRKHGITNAQARYLAYLQKNAGERYRGKGMSRQQASREIERLLAPTPLEEELADLDRAMDIALERDSFGEPLAR